MNNHDKEFDLLDTMYNIEQKEETDNIEEDNSDCDDDNENTQDNYYIPEELKKSENGFTFLNIFMCYYKKLFYKTESINMFEEIDYSDVKSTNRMMEFLYSEVYKYKKFQNDDEFVALYEPNIIDINTCEELYALTIDGKYNKVCRFIIPIITYISENYDWTKVNWAIIPLK